MGSGLIADLSNTMSTLPKELQSKFNSTDTVLASKRKHENKPITSWCNLPSTVTSAKVATPLVTFLVNTNLSSPTD